MKKQLKDYTDIELISIIRKHKQQRSVAFSELYDRHSVNVRNFIYYMIQNSEQSEDIFQETFITFFNNIVAGKEIQNTKPYLLSIARNLCLKYYRDKKITVPLDRTMFVVDERNQYENNEMFSLIVKALQLLDEKYREAFIMREFEGMPYNEIAKVCDTSVTNAKSRVFRAHKKLIKILEPYLKDLAK